MQRTFVKGLTIALALSPAVAWTQSATAPKAATYITAEEVQTVNKLPGVDRTIRVVDIGDQNFAVGIIHRGPTGAAARGAGAPAAAAPSAGAARGGGQPQGEPCGEQATGAPPSGLAGGIYHEKQTEGYLITSGSGTMVTGGHIINGRKSAPNAEVTTTLNGPSCSGQIGGGPGGQRGGEGRGKLVFPPRGSPRGGGVPPPLCYFCVSPPRPQPSAGS